ncbi:DNA internalization-related competence protein ComEC/Rec2 [Marinisporobacter balticus]|uniref:Competence protein ComEC n=1 Tax=Marinisporobacter balticus TaxID=2018667 RepID=A0A4R2L0W1_9FIRM|nr:DNA internalization-related competence protein ComEC/Rec2 [Marinisporobacter balticus]TCO80064.1 competence protein ComEC [Marinisporobacter balticus]
MRRPICGITIFYILGILIQCTSAISYKGMLGIFVLATIIGSYINKKKCRTIILFSIILLWGALNFSINKEYEGQLKAFFDEKVYVVGDVVDASYKERMQLILKGIEIRIDGKKYRFSDKLIVKLKGKYDPAKKIIGKRVAIQGVLTAPQKRRNPKMFDYHMYLKTKKIYSVLYGDTRKIKIIGDGDISFVSKSANYIKSNVVYRILNALPKKEANILVGILLGDKDGLDIDIYTTFKKVGIAHILAVSGLHVGILYMVLNKLLKGVSQDIRTMTILVILFFYVMITGCAPSVLRAALMASVLICAPMLNRRYDSLSAIFMIAFILLLINPIYFIHIGFQLSFVATLSIILFYKKILMKITCMPEFLRQIFAVSMAAQIGIIPIVAYYFNYISLGALVINIPIVMLVSLIVPLGLFMIFSSFISLSFASILGQIIFCLIKMLVVLSKITEAISFSNIEVISPSLFFIGTYYILFLLLLVDGRKRWGYYFSRKKGMFITMGIYVSITVLLYVVPDNMNITFIDVGQGDCILIQTPRGKNILIDGGGSHQENIDVGEDILVPCLLRNGIRKIDLMILSHIHKDHIGGLLSVLDHLKVNVLMIGTDHYQSEDLNKMKEKCAHQKTKIYQVRKDDKISIEEHMLIKILHPSKQLITGTRDDENNNSLVALMMYKGKRILFTGDIEAEAEDEILKTYPDLSVDVLKIAHHGSYYSSTQKFITATKPKVAIVQVGKNNFGHPHKAVLNRLKNNGTYIFRNDKNGAVRVTFDEKKIKVKKMIQ